MKDNCPLCLGELNSLYHTEDHTQSGHHYRCSICGHGWYIADLMGVVSASLSGKTPEQIKELILKRDKEKEDAGKSING